MSGENSAYLSEKYSQQAKLSNVAAGLEPNASHHRLGDAILSHIDALPGARGTG
jgi:hypothetical protein